MHGNSNIKFIVVKQAKEIYSVLVVVNKHNTATVASCWFIIYYINKGLLIFVYPLKGHNFFFVAKTTRPPQC